MNGIPELLRELTPFEKEVMVLVCQGFTNAAIATQIHQSEKIIENTISRLGNAFKFSDRSNHNLRVLLTIAYRAHFGDPLVDNQNPPNTYKCETCVFDQVESEEQKIKLQRIATTLLQQMDE